MTARRVVVFHRCYGCETGCCGHAIAVDPEPDDTYHDYNHVEVQSTFEFAHADGEGEDAIEWAKDFVRKHLGAEHVADLDWEKCLVLSYDTCPM